MKNQIIIVLAVMLLLGACAAPRQKLSPQANVALKSANVYYAQKDTEQALPLYQQVLANNPDHVIALRRVGDINLYNGETFADRAVEFNKAAYENYARALVAYETFIEVTDDDIIDKRDIAKRKESAWIRIYKEGEKQKTEGNSKDALSTFELAYALDNNRIEPLIRMKEIYTTDLNDKVKAEQIMLQLYSAKPNELPIIQELAAYYYNEKNYSEALKYFEQARLQIPNDSNNLLNIAACHTELKDYTSASSVIEQVLSLEPTNVDALTNAQMLALATNNNTARIGYLKRLLQIRDNSDDYTTICALLNIEKQYVDLLTYAGKWYDYDNTSKTAVQFLLLGAQQTQDKALIKRYTDILQKMQ